MLLFFWILFRLPPPNLDNLYNFFERQKRRGSRKMTWWQGGGRGARYRPKGMTSFMNSPLYGWLEVFHPIFADQLPRVKNTHMSRSPLIKWSLLENWRLRLRIWFWSPYSSTMYHSCHCARMKKQGLWAIYIYNVDDWRELLSNSFGGNSRAKCHLW